MHQEGNLPRERTATAVPKSLLLGTCLTWRNSGKNGQVKQMCVFFQ